MMEFVRRLFRRKPKPTHYLEGLYALAMRRGQERCKTCGDTRMAHAPLRSGLLMCPLKDSKPDLRYNPLEVDECFYPSRSEPHFKCDRCGCARGVHRPEGHKRKECLDPQCPGCPGGCT